MSKQKRKARRVKLSAKGVMASAILSILGFYGIDAIGGDPSANSTYASNYSYGSDVNPQTGQVPLSIQMLSLPGINDKMGLSLGVIMNQDKPAYGISNKKMGFALPYLDMDDNGGRFYSGTGNTYIIDREYKSGFRYINNESVRYEQKEGSFVNSRGATVSYRHAVSNLNGWEILFDSVGKIKGFVDKYGKSISFFYKNEDSDPFKCELSEIIDSFGQSIRITSDQGITVTRPDGKMASLVINEMENKALATDFSGVTQSISYDPATGRVNEKHLSTGGVIRYTYKPVLKYGSRSDEAFYAVTEVEEDPCDGSASVITRYEYGRDDDREHNFTGFNHGVIKYDPNSDQLMESNDDTYFYSTYITKAGDGKTCLDSTDKMTFNRLHLQINNETLDQGGCVVSKSETWYSGELTGSSHVFPGYNGLPGNYDLGRVTESVRYFSDMTSRKSISETEYDNNGLLRQEIGYNYKFGEAPRAVCSTLYGYYDRNNYCLPKSVRISYENGNRTGERTMINKLTPDGREIGSSTITEAGSQLVITNTRDYDENGRVRLSELSASDSLQKDRNIISYNEPGADGILAVRATNAVGLNEEKGIDIRNGQVKYEISQAGKRTDYKYENDGLVVTAMTNDGTWKKTDYSAMYKPGKRYVEVSHSNGMKLRSYVDGLGRTVRETQWKPGLGTEVQMSSTKYNCLGNKVLVTDSKGNATSYEYLDRFNRLTRSVDSLGNTKETRYDDIDNRNDSIVNDVEVASAFMNDSGEVVHSESRIRVPDSHNTFISDSSQNGLGNPTEAGLSGSVNGRIMHKAMRYDAMDRMVRSSTRLYQDGYSAYGDNMYDIHGKLITSQSTIEACAENQVVASGGNVNVSMTTSYDSSGRVRRMTDLTGRETSIEYRNDGLMSIIKDNHGPNAVYDYDSITKDLKTMTIGSLKYEMEYFPKSGNKFFAGALKSIRLLENDMEKDKISYEFNSDGFQTRKIYETQGVSASVEYDAFDRVKTSTDFAGVTTLYRYYDRSSAGVNFDSIKSIESRYGKVVFDYYTRKTNPLLGDGDAIKNQIYLDKDGREVMTKRYEYASSLAGEGAASQYVRGIYYETNTAKGTKLLAGFEYTYDDMERISSVTQKSGMFPNDLNCNNIKEYDYNSLGKVIRERIKTLSGAKAMDFELVWDTKGNLKKITTDNAVKGTKTVREYTYDSNGMCLFYIENGDKVEFTYENGRLKERKGRDESYVNEYNSLSQHTRMLKNGTSDIRMSYDAEGSMYKIQDSSYPDNNKTFYKMFSHIFNEFDESGNRTTYLGLEADGQTYLARFMIPKGRQAPVEQWYITGLNGVINGVYQSSPDVILTTYHYGPAGEIIDLK